MATDYVAGDHRTNRERMLVDVGAGAVVTRDIPANVVTVGSPARVVREIQAPDAGG